jgi:hypothetical protein
MEAWFSRLGADLELTTLPRKIKLLQDMEQQQLDGPILRRKDKRLKDLKIGSWNVLSLYRLRWGDSVNMTSAF